VLLFLELTVSDEKTDLSVTFQRLHTYLSITIQTSQMKATMGEQKPTLPSLAARLSACVLPRTELLSHSNL